MDAQSALTGLIAEVARGLLGAGGLPADPSDEDLAAAFHAAVGEMDPVEYEELLLTLPADALRTLAVAGYATTTHLLYACGARGEIPGGVDDYLGTVLFALPEGDALDRFLAAAWFGFAYGATTKDGVRSRGEPVVTPEASAEAVDLLRARMREAGYPDERADGILQRACTVTADSAVTLPEAYIHAGAQRAMAGRPPEP